MSPERKRALVYTAVPFAVCAGLAALLGGLLRPAEPSPEALEPLTAPAPRASAEVETRRAEAPAVSARPAPIVVETPAPVERHYDPLPPLPPGTTTQDLIETYANEVCACVDMACVDEAALRHHRYFGQAVRVRKAVDNRAVDVRVSKCIADLRDDEQGG